MCYCTRLMFSAAAAAGELWGCLSRREGGAAASERNTADGVTGAIGAEMMDWEFSGEMRPVIVLISARNGRVGLQNSDACQRSEFCVTARVCFELRENVQTECPGCKLVSLLKCHGSSGSFRTSYPWSVDFGVTSFRTERLLQPIGVCSVVKRLQRNCD